LLGSVGRLCRWNVATEPLDSNRRQQRRPQYQPPLLQTYYQPLASLPALGPPWAPPSAERGPSLENIYRVSLTVDLCEGNKMISLKKLFHHSQLRALKKKKIRGLWARAQCAHWLRWPCCQRLYSSNQPNQTPVLRPLDRSTCINRHFQLRT